MEPQYSNDDLRIAVNEWQNILTTRGINDKMDLLSKSSELLQDACYYAYNPYYTYGVKKIPNYKHDDDCIEFPLWTGFISVLKKCKGRDLTGNAAIDAVTFILSQCPVEMAAFLECILDRDLKMGLQTKSINKVWPGLIPTFDVALAMKVDKIENLTYPLIVQPHDRWL